MTANRRQWAGETGIRLPVWGGGSRLPGGWGQEWEETGWGRASGILRHSHPCNRDGAPCPTRSQGPSPSPAALSPSSLRLDRHPAPRQLQDWKEGAVVSQWELLPLVPWGPQASPEDKSGVG